MLLVIQGASITARAYAVMPLCFWPIKTDFMHTRYLVGPVLNHRTLRALLAKIRVTSALDTRSGKAPPLFLAVSGTLAWAVLGRSPVIASTLCALSEQFQYARQADAPCAVTPVCRHPQFRSSIPSFLAPGAQSRTIQAHNS